MGEYISKLEGDSDEIILTHPKKPDWIVAHVRATGMSLVEVERLWSRFQQLGCSEDGIIGHDVLRLPVARNDKFVRNILVAMLGTRHQVSFLLFLRVLHWAETSPTEEKVKAIFSLLHNGEPVSKDLMFKILRATYPNDADETVWRTTEAVMSQVCSTNESSISERQFIEATKTIQSDKLASLTHFRIVPIDVLDDAYKIFNMPEGAVGDSYKKMPSSELLKNIAGNTGKGDISILATKLGFTTIQLENIQSDHRNDRSLQVEMLLCAWRERKEHGAYVGDLKKALVEARMNEAANLITIK